MYSEQLERLIQVCLADGVITEKERDVICKKAKSLGIDEDEVMVYVEGLLAEMQSKKKSSKEGEKHTCPNCGANIPAMVDKCPECGFEIRDNRASNAVSKFAEQYQSADVERQISLVQSFPIPNNKEDLYEFTSLAMPLAMSLHKMPFWQIIVFVIGIDIALALLLSYIDTSLGILIGMIGFIALIGLVIKSDSDNDDKQNKQEKKLGKAWEAKLDQSLIKSKFFSSNDPQFATKIAQVSKEYVNKKRLTYIVLAVVWAVVFVVGLIFMSTPPADTETSNDDESDWKESLHETKEKIDAIKSIFGSDDSSESSSEDN